MIETFTALLFAHVLADFALQTDWINKNKRNPLVLLLHGGIVLGTALLALGHYDAWPIYALALAHLAIDAVKTYGGFRSFSAFMADQTLHLCTLIAVAIYAPTLWETGQWVSYPQLLPIMAILTGLLVALIAGQYAVGLLMRPHSARIRQRGLRTGGRQIGLLERGLIFLFVLSGQAIGVGFLIAAKSILRFGTASKDQTSAEYVIIGTLASFGWAFLAAEATQVLLSALPPLEIRSIAP